MKKTKLLICFLLIVSGILPRAVFAQCSFTPTVTPTGLIMCPDTQDTIWTQQYDSYQWYVGGFPVPGATSQYFVADYWMHSGFHFKVSATLNGCTEMSDSVLVDGWAFLPPVVSSNGNSTLCPGGQDSVIFRLLLPYTQNFQWYNNGVAIPGANDDSLVVYAPGVYTVEGSPAQCQNYSPMSLPLLVDMYGYPVIAPASLMVCSNDADTIYSVTPYNAYQWHKDGVPIPGATSNFITVADPGYYHLVATKSDCTLPSDSSYVQVYPVATLSIALSGGALNLTTSGTVSGIQWYRNGAPIPGATGPSYTPGPAGVYTVTAQDSFCTVTSGPFTYPPVSVDDPAAGIVSVSPNPVDELLRIDAPAPFTVLVQSMDGRVLLRGESATVNTTALPSGMYIVAVLNSEGRLLLRQPIIKK